MAGDERALMFGTTGSAFSATFEMETLIPRCTEIATEIFVI
jgi:hypothetical protein